VTKKVCKTRFEFAELGSFLIFESYTQGATLMDIAAPHSSFDVAGADFFGSVEFGLGGSELDVDHVLGWMGAGGRVEGGDVGLGDRVLELL
jgi:hypothetical protein